MINPGGGGALSVDLLRQAKRKLDDDDVPAEDRHISVSPSGMEDLLNESEVTSADYNLRALVRGEVTFYMGFEFHMISPTIMPLASGVRSAIVHQRDAMGLGMIMDLRTTVDRLPTKRNALGVYVVGTWDAVRIQEEGVVEIKYTE